MKTNPSGNNNSGRQPTGHMSGSIHRGTNQWVGRIRREQRQEPLEVRHRLDTTRLVQGALKSVPSGTE